MSICIRHALGHGLEARWCIVIAVCLGLAAVDISRASWADAALVQAAAHEESLLVATREALPADSPAQPAVQSADEDSLEPISQTSESTPELATNETTSETADEVAGESANEFAAGLREADEGAKPRAKKVAQQVPAIDDGKPGKLTAINSSSTTTAAPPADAAQSALEPVRFRGILVGKSTKGELVTAWGQPARTASTDEGSVLGYDIHPFQAVEVLIAPDDLVAAIKVALSAPLEAKSLARQLSLDGVPPATATNDREQPLGQVFPERGVLFMFDASDSDALAGDGGSAPTVTHVVIHPIDAQSFVLRAESRLHGHYQRNIHDLQTAIELDPNYAHAYWLLAQIYLATGQADQADEAAEKACELEPHNAAFQLCRGRTHELLGEYDNSVLTVRAVLDREDLAQIDRAQALYQMAQLASLGDVEIASKAITFHTRAIEIADELATSTKNKERRAAKQILVEAHLAVAEEIARQSFSNKVENLSQWIGRASGLAENYIADDGGSVELRLIVAQRALAALASFRPTLDPAPWVAEANEAADRLLAQSDDELWHSRVKWELGLAYFNALRVDHLRRETATALRYGMQAVDQFASGAGTRQAVHGTEGLVGQLYFQIGAVHAVHQLDHAKAAQWYLKAEPLLTAPRPISELYSPRREGEMLVSMGVTFWQLGDKDRALELTQGGVDLVELAVEDGILAKSALAVPYGNLATMYRQLGQDKSAAKYSELAKTVAAGTPPQPPRVGRTPGNSASGRAVQTNAQQRQPMPARR